MLNSIKTLLTSKRALLAFLIAVFDVVVLLGGEVPPELAESLATLVTTLGGVLIAGISHSDHGAAMGQPAGTDHKGRCKSAKCAPKEDAPASPDTADSPE